MSPADQDTLLRYWLVVNGAVIIATAFAILDAIKDRRAIRQLDGHAAHIAAQGTLRREVVRLVAQLGLLGIAAPLLLGVPRWVGVACLLLVPVTILVNTIGDAIDRVRLEHEARTDMERERAARNRRWNDPK